MRDNLPTLFKKGQSMIINLDDSNGQGTHWVGAYHNDKEILYFDSFGVSPPEELRKYKRKMKYQTMQVQDIKSVNCGWYVIYFLNEVSKGVDMYDLVYLYDILNQAKNEKHLENYFKTLKI